MTIYVIKITSMIIEYGLFVLEFLIYTGGKWLNITSSTIEALCRVGVTGITDKMGFGFVV